MPDETCGKKEEKPLTKPCAKCGAPIEYNMEGMSRPYCEKCLSCKKKTAEYRNYLREHPDSAEKRRKENRKRSKIRRESGVACPSESLKPLYREKELSLKHAMLYDEPCFFCEFGCCSGIRKVYVTVSGKTIVEELGIDVACCSATTVSKENIQALLDRDRFIVCCSHHSAQINGLRQYHEEMDFDDVIEEVIHRCK